MYNCALAWLVPETGMVYTAFAFALMVLAESLAALVERTEAVPGTITDRRCSVAGETYRAARAGCAETTCDRRSIRGGCGGGIVRGCFCRPGLYRNRQRVCVLPAECH